MLSVSRHHTKTHKLTSLDKSMHNIDRCHARVRSPHHRSHPHHDSSTGAPGVVHWLHYVRIVYERVPLHARFCGLDHLVRGIDRPGDLKSLSDVIAHVSYRAFEDIDVVENADCERSDNLLIH